MFIGQGVGYMPGASSLSATHRGKVKNIRMAALKENQVNADSRTSIFRLEKETLNYDSEQKKQSSSKFIHTHNTYALYTHK